MTGFDSKVLRDEPDGYRISFYTDSKEAYELVQAACRLCVDAKNQKQEARPEVIRCQDCCYAEPSMHPACIVCSNLGVTMGQDDFCSQGERRRYQ